MGWWESSEGLLVGDEPLDAADEFISKLIGSYVEEQGRKPTLEELLECVRLTIDSNVDAYVSSPNGVEIVSIKFKTKALPKCQKLMPGSVFCVPLKDGFFAFGRMTPQSLIADFYQVKSKKRLNARVLENFPIFRYKTMVPDDAFRKGRWVVFGKMDYPSEGFVPTMFRGGNRTYCGTEVVDGFIEISSASRLATDDEMRTISPLSISNIPMAEWNLEESLKDAPII